MNYYYLDLIDRKGPFSPKELKLLNLDPNTLILHDGSTEWKALKDMLDLNNETENEELIAEELFEKDLHQNLEEQKISKKEIKIQIPLFILLSLGIVILFGLSFLAAIVERNYYKSEFNKEIDTYFNGSHYMCKLVEFENFEAIKKPIVLESKTYHNSESIIKDYGGPEYYTLDQGLCVDHKTIFEPIYTTKPNRKNFKSDDSFNQASDSYSIQLKNWNKLLFYKDYYKIQCSNCVKSIYQSDMFELVYYKTSRYFKDILLKGSFDLSMEDLKTLYYNRLISLATVNDNNDLDQFFYISNKYYYFKADGDSFSKQSVTGKKEYIENENCIIWFEDNNQIYVIEEKENNLIIYWLVYSVISSIVFLSTILFVKYRKRYKIAFSVKK